MAEDLRDMLLTETLDEGGSQRNSRKSSTPGVALCRVKGPGGAFYFGIATTCFSVEVTSRSSGDDLRGAPNSRRASVNARRPAGPASLRKGETTMALSAEGRRYCKVAWVEQGRMVVRRVHFMLVQAGDGRIYQLSDDKLPDAFVLSTGKPYEDKHLAQVLLNPTRRTLECPSIFELLAGWPSGRDMLHIVIGSLLTSASLLGVCLYLGIRDLM